MGNTLNVLQFNCSPHPYHLPNFMEVFQWSMPFVVEKITEMLYYILQPNNLEDEDDDKEPESLPAAMQKLYRKSLTQDQNEAVELAARLAKHIHEGKEEGGDSSGGGKLSKAKGDRLRKKIRTVARMARVFKTLRQENETVIRLKGVCPGHKLAPGLLLSGKEALNSELDRFDFATNVDKDNE